VSGSARARIQRRQLVVVGLIVVVIVPIFNVLTAEATWLSAVHGMLDAVLITLAVGGYLMFVRDGWLRLAFRRLGFAVTLAINSVVVLVLFLLCRAVGQVVMTLQPRRFLSSFGDAHLVYALPFFVALAVTVQFVLQMNRMIGADVLRYWVQGVYHRPRREERLFLFLDLEGSTQLAERLGSATYFLLLRRFVDDLTEPVLACEGEIYQYAGDEVVLTWPQARGVRAANCVRCFFAIREAITARAAAYQRDFAVVPRFRAGLHGGTVTAGQLGDLRQQIVFVGDILNTAARLEEYAKRTGRDLVASGEVLEHLTLPAGIVAERCGELELRGKDARVIAYALSGSLSRGS
jgi:adenylate cyclase